MAVGTGFAAGGGGGDAGNVSRESADAVLVGGGFEGLGGGAKAAEGVEGGAWADGGVGVAGLGG